MSLKKHTAMLCIMALILSLFSIPAAAGATGEAKYMIINDQFGNNDNCGWERATLSTCKVFSTINTEEIGNDNYALTYESVSTSASPSKSDWYGEYLKKELEGNGIKFTEGVDVVIKTRIKQNNTGRAFLKFNAPLIDSTDAWNKNWGTLFGNEEGHFFTPSGYNANGAAHLTYWEKEKITLDISANTWYEVEITIHGNTKTASYKVTQEGGETQDLHKNMSIDNPDAANMEEDFLQYLVFRLRAAEKLWVDYIQVWQEGIKVTGAETVSAMNSVDVKLTANSALLSGISDYIDLYDNDGTNLIETQKSFNPETNNLTLIPQNGFSAGEFYKLKIDTSGIDTDLKYTWECASELVVEAPACVAVNLGINGKLIPGTELEAVYDLNPAGAVEGASEFIWYTVDENGDKTIIGGQTGKTFAVTQDYVDSVITYSVIPQCVVEGVTKTGLITNFDDVVKPLSAPVITNPGFAPENPIVGYSLSASYDYYDADGDVEDGSIITWYKADAIDGDFEEFATGKTIEVPEKGMYYKYTVIPKNGALFRNEGEMVASAVSAYSNDIIEATNLFVNGDAEDGVVAPWEIMNNSGSYVGLTVVNKDDNADGVYSGNYSFQMHPRFKNNDNYRQEITLGAGKTYIASAMMKSATSDNWSGLEAYIQDIESKNHNNYTKLYRMKERTEVTNEWTRVTLTFSTSAQEKYKLGWLSFDAYGADVYVDDMYIGELLISDIITNKIKPITIPKHGEEPVKVSVLTTENGRILNQFGETDGLLDQKAVVSIPSDVKGVTVKDNMLYVDSNAVAGKVPVTVKCIPNYNLPGENGNIIPVKPAQSEFEKTVEIELVAHNDKTPVAKDVKAEGVVETGNTLTGSYTFHQVENMSDNSEVKWVYSDTENGTYKDIPGATGMTYTVTSEYADKFIKFVVIPKTEDGLAGTAVFSDILAKPRAPYAYNISVSGDFKVGSTITGNYDFKDVNHDNESGTIYKWYASDNIDAGYSEINGETGNTLELTEALTAKYIKFGVTPVSDVIPRYGVEVLSQAYMGPVAPVAKDVAIVSSGNRLSGKYTYYHEHNAPETNSVYKWTVDGNTVSTTSDYVVNFVGTKTVTFTVIPVGDTMPSIGKPVSVSAVISGGAGNVGGNTSVGGFVGSGSSGGSGGSGGGGGIVSGIININDMDYVEETPEETPTEEDISDINGHWGAEYIKVMEERGIMSADEEGKYNPDELVDRQDMLTYLFKTLKLEATDYSGMFDDVTDSEFGGILQTMVDNGTISVDTSFRPGDSISREEMCKILYISLENAGKLENVEEGAINHLADFSEVSDWAVKYVNAMYSIEMMIGVSEDRFAPQENLTKAQAATLLTRIISLVEGE